MVFLSNWYFSYAKSKAALDKLIDWFDNPFKNDDATFIDKDRTIVVKADNVKDTILVSLGLTTTRIGPAIILNTDNGVYFARERDYKGVKKVDYDF